MEAEVSVEQLLLRIKELETRCEESEQLIDAIKAGEVDAFAINNGDSSEVYTLQSIDHAYRILIEEFEEGAINVTEDGLIVYTNPYFFELVKLPYDEVIGKPIFNFIDPKSQAKFDRLFEAAISGKSKGKINLKVKDSVVPVYISLTSLQPKLACVGIIITDFTEKKKNEKIILAYQRDLENKNHELIQGNAELASFAYVASHDLQEPLRKIQTFASMITETEFGNLSEKGKDYFNRIFISAKRMQRLIEDLLTYSRTNTGERNYEDTDLNRIVEEVKEDLKEDIEQKNATIVTDLKCHVHVIRFQFRQLLHNLISNSLKFSSPERGTYIIIKSEMGDNAQFKNDKLSDNVTYCHISISDNGIGFEQEYSEKIFELFQRLHGRATYSGTGIGLAIVKKIIENHNGIITANGELGKGATFDIYIPSV